MNKAYRVIWNACTNTWTAVQENAKAKGKSSSGRVSAEPATLGSLGLKSSRFVCTALASALMMTAGYANAGPGIFINDGNDAGCIVTSDESSRRNALFFLSNNNLEWAAEPTSGGSMPSANAFRNKCSPADAASQTNRALFHGDAGGAGSKHLSLGGRLDVNSGIIGLGDRAAGNNSIRIGSGNTLDAANSQSNSVAIGNDVETKAAMAVGIGSAAKANGVQSVAVGNSVESSGYYSVAIGTSARANAAQTVALGNNANAAGEDALAIGRSANAQAKDSIAFGRSSQAAAKGVAIGSEASAAVANSVALGSGTTAVAATNQSGTKNVNGLNYTYVGDSANSSVTVGNRQIKQVGAGEVSAASTDAINGSQLYATQNVIGNIGKGVATNLGGGAALKPDGTFTAPTYNLTDANGNAVSKNNVGDALNVLDSRLNTVGGGFQVAAATGTTQTVKPGNTLKFIDGTNTTTEVSTDGAGVTTVKINATGGGAAVPLTSNAATGQVNAPAAADANKATTAGSVATAINTAVSKSGFNVQGGSVAGGSVTGAATTKVNNGSTVKLQAGKNIALSQSGADFTFATAENLSVTSVTATDAAGNKTVTNGSGVTITPAAAGSSPVRLTTSGLDNGGNKITNLTSGNVAAGDNSAVTGGAVNTAINTAINTAVTDLKDAGFKIGADSGADDTVKLGETVKYAGDANIKTTVTNNQIGFKLADSITVGPASGGNPVTVDGSAGTVTGLTNKTWNPAGIVSGRAATEDQLKAVTNQVNSSATHYYSVNDGGGAHGGNFNNDGATGLNALAAGVGASAQDNDAVAIGSGTIAQGNGSIAIGAAAEVSGATGAGGIAIGAAATAKNGGTAVGSGADTGNGTALIPGLPNRLNNNLALGDSARVKNDTNFNVALGSLSTAGDADLTAAAYKPNATSVIAGDINEAGVKYGEVSLGGDTSHFMSGSKMYRRLTNLAAGSADTDAVNVSQLKAVQAALQDQAPVAYTKADGTKVYKHTDGNFYDAPNGAGNQVAAADVITSLQNAAGSTTAPTTLANVKDNLADTAAAVTNPTGNDRTTLSANKGHNAATVNDVLNAGFTVQGNGVDEDFVTHGDTVNFVNGQGTVANVSSTGGVTTVKFDTPMTYVDTAGTPATTPSNKVNLVGTGGPVTLGNVAAGAVNATSTDAVNGSQLFATNQNVANNAVNIAKGINFGGTTGSKNYALGDTINVKGDSNIISETVAGGAQLKLADVLNVGQAAPVKIDGNKGEVSGLSNTTLGGSDFAQGKRAATEEQLNAAQDQLVNVLGGNAANNGGNISMTDIGGTGENNIHDAIKAVNATANLPLTFGGDSGKDVERKPGTKLNIVGGQTDAAKLSDGNIGVVANGSDKLEVKLAKDLAVDSVKAGDTTVNTDGVKVGDVNLTKAGLNNGGNKITNVAAGTDDTDAVNVAQLNKAAAAAKTEVVQGDNIVVTQNVGANGQTIYKVATDKNLKVDSVTAGDTVMNNDGVKVGDDVALNKDGVKVGDVNLTKAGLNNGGNKITNVAAGTDDTDAVNVSQLKQAATASKTEVVQGKNIVVTEKTGDKGQTVYEVATDKDLDVDSVKAGDTTVNNDGVKVGDDVALNKDGLKAGKVNLTKDGLDNAGNKVTNVADGDINANSKDAVNGSQLYATNQNVANNAATIAKGINFGGTTGSNNYALGDTINVKGDSNIISETVAGGAQLKLADVLNVGQAAPVKIDGNKGEVSGLSNTTLGGSDFAQGKRAATEEQLNAAQEQLVNVLGGNAANNGGNISMTDIGGTGENNIHDAIKAVNATANLPLTFGGDSGKDVERKPGTKLNIVGGQTDAAKLSDGNIGVVANGSDKLEVKLAKDLAVDSVKAGDTTVNTDGVKVGDVNLTKAGLDNGGNKITNVAAGTDDTDAVNVAQLNKAAAAAKTEVVQGDNIVVTQDVGANGQTIYKVATDKNLKVDSVTAGDTVVNNDGVKVGDDVALNKDGLKAGDVNLTKAGLNNGGNKITNVAAGTDDTDAVNVSQLKQAAAASKTEVVQGKNIVVTQKTGDKGQTVYEVATDKDLDVDSVKAGDTTVNTDGVKVGDDVALNKDGLKAGKVNLTKDGLDNAGNKVTNVADGDLNANSKDAVNGSQLHATNQNVANNAATIAKGINFGGTTGSNNYALGSTINVKGDSNIISETVAGGAQLKLADEISVKTVNADTFKAGDTVMNNDGVKVGDKVALNKDGLTAGNTVVNNDGVTIAAPTENNPNNQVKLSPVGLNNGGQRITNVAPGKDGTDAANVNQLIGLGTELQNNINQVGKKAYAGVAGAIAQGSIPQVTSPGETGIGVGSGYYGGQSAMAIGVSAMSDGGNWIVKGNFSANTDGHVGVGAGALYQW